MPEKPNDHARSPHWPAFRAEWLKANPACAVCGTMQHVEAHHCKPFHLWPELELDATNLLTLCESPGSDHHLFVGHCADWKKFNPAVREDAAVWNAKIKTAPMTRTD